MAVSIDLYRELFRRWPSGVAVVTTVAEERPLGMVVSSLCSLSADPPLVMFSANLATRTYTYVEQIGIFAASILREDQVTIFERFAGIDRSHDDDRFAGLTATTAETGCQVFPDALAWLDCRVVARHPGPTYMIFVGEILAAGLGSAAEAPPLVYFRRQRRQLADLPS